MVKEALVVPREELFTEKYFQGFLPANEYNFLPVILAKFDYHPRGEELENNQGLQQIVPYLWLINPKTRKIFAYRRATNQNYAEKRLRNKWSCGIGGHIERIDGTDPIMASMMRELQEEVRMAKYPAPKIVGYLNDDKDDVGKVHFGIVAIAETLEEVVEKGDDEMAECKFLNIEEFESLLNNPEIDIEDWTRISWPFVKKYLNGD